MEKYFEIRNSLLTYDEKNVRPRFPIGLMNKKKKPIKDLKVILQVEKLELENELAFVFGFSGSGKSTLLEALGLMNDTIVEACPGFESGSDIKPLFNTGLGNLEELWFRKNKKKLLDARKNHYSFVFQSTVLLPNFTVVDNIILPTLIEGKTDYYVSYIKALILLRELNLCELKVSTYHNQVSGGQRQRIAFARAFLPAFDVLFGDEPTGNLDEINAEHLFNFLKFNIIQKGRCAVIVSHSIELTLKFADKIVILTRKKDKELTKGTACLIDPSSVYKRKNRLTDKIEPIVVDVERLVAEYGRKEIIRLIDSVRDEKNPKTQVKDILLKLGLNNLPEVPDCSINGSEWTSLDGQSTLSEEKMKALLRNSLYNPEFNC
jgi:lipoprotein-releasing system ATP-binding protein